jgi:selenocysteine-specific elongation factor
VRLHLGSACVPARLLLLRGETLAPGQRLPAQLRLESPLFALAGDRFVLRDAAEQTTLAGGTVLDPDAPRGRSRAPERVALLEGCAADPEVVDPFLRHRLQQSGVQRTDALLFRSRFPARTVATGLGRLLAGGEAILAGSLVAPAALWNPCLEAAGRLIDRLHAERPELPGLPLAELRAGLEGEFQLREGFDELLAALARRGFASHGAFVRRAEHRPALPPELHAAGQRLRAVLTGHLLDPPNRRELAPDLGSQKALRFLVQSAEVIELDADTVLSVSAFNQARDRIRVFLKQRVRATASDLRQLLGTSRRILIPLLEKLDRDGVTRRDGDFRVLR